MQPALAEPPLWAVLGHRISAIAAAHIGTLCRYGVSRVHLSLAPFWPVGVGYGCHRGWLKSAEAGPRSCAAVAGRHGTADCRRRLEPENQLHNDGLPRVALKMATGTGKIVVIAMIIAWQATRCRWALG
jgi:hypothetical protein